MSTKSKALIVAALGVLAGGLLVLREPKIVSGVASSYGSAHAYSYLNNTDLIWLHVISDSVIFLSYAGIAIVLAYLVYRTRRELPFSWMVLAFGTFIIALSRRVLTLQDEERRRLGRELHDSAGQLLAAIRLNLGIVSQWTNTDPRSSAKLADTAALADQAIAEIRTLSYLLHPPMLDETGLAGAVEWYVHGFGERSKIAVTLEIDPGLGRFHRDVETAIFRIVQECLVNIHRHSASRTAFISLQSTSSGISLAIRDEGKGISLQALREEGGDLGVGIRGMRERARQLGGSLDIQSANPGTLVAVTLPAIKAAPTGDIALSEAAG